MNCSAEEFDTGSEKCTESRDRDEFEAFAVRERYFSKSRDSMVPTALDLSMAHPSSMSSAIRYQKMSL